MLVAQMSRFAGVGVVATVLHVGTALYVQSQFGMKPLLSNLAGFTVAFGFSYAGHALVTFCVAGNHTRHMGRFFVVSVLGLALSSTITLVFHQVLEAPFSLAMAAVALCVPGFSFVASRKWAFSQPDNQR